MSSNTILNETIRNMFSQNNAGLSRQLHLAKNKGGTGPSVKDLEFALAVLLTDLASCDQNFDQREFECIVGGMYRVFGTRRTEVEALVNKAKVTLSDPRGINRFIETLRDSIDATQRRMIKEIIDETIQADDVEDGFEIYLRNKFYSMLGIQEDSAAKESEPTK